MFEFMYQQIAAQQRPVGFYPETSYWVNYDTEVPLFLPVYAYQRLRDLRGIARQEVPSVVNRRACRREPRPLTVTACAAWPRRPVGPPAASGCQDDRPKHV